MTKTQKYLEQLRTKLEEVEKKKIYDKRLYDLLNVPSQSFSRYINGQRTMPDHVAVKVADYLHLERLQIIAEIHEENAETEEEKQTWTQALKMIASGFIGISLITTMTLAPTGDAIATSDYLNAPHYILYVFYAWLISCLINCTVSNNTYINKELKKWNKNLEMCF